MESWSVFRLLTYFPRYVFSTQATSPSNILKGQGGRMGVGRGSMETLGERILDDQSSPLVGLQPPLVGN